MSLLRRILPLLLAAIVGGLLLADSTRGQTPDAARDEVSYRNDIRPIVKNFCVTCHSGEDPSGELVLDTYEDVLRVSRRGVLLRRIHDEEDPMPPKGLLPKNMRRLFRKWAEGGYRKAGTTPRRDAGREMKKFEPPAIQPVDVRKQGFEFLARMQGHWTGSMWLMGQEFDWFAFDYRAIAPAHVHGIFEGGTMGNLFTSFFVTDFKGTRTIMARNGGILNGIYRTSYFVLSDVDESDGATRYRFIDAYGGKGIMWMDVTFRGDAIEFVAYTSRMGLLEPTRHMRFVGRRRSMELAAAAARAVGFPKDVVDLDLSKGLPTPNWGGQYAITSATYLWEEKARTLVELGKRARDPYRIDQMPYLSQLAVSVKRTPATRGKKLFLFLSQKALTEKDGRFLAEHGYVRADLLDTLLSFPELAGSQDAFTFTYLHPGIYYLTVVADLDGDGLPGPGDISHPRTKVVVKPKSKQAVHVDELNVLN